LKCQAWYEKNKNEMKTTELIFQKEDVSQNDQLRRQKSLRTIVGINPYSNLSKILLKKYYKIYIHNIS
jgi:hypothetical protein